MGGGQKDRRTSQTPAVCLTGQARRGQTDANRLGGKTTRRRGTANYGEDTGQSAELKRVGQYFAHPSDLRSGGRSDQNDGSEGASALRNVQCRRSAGEGGFGERYGTSNRQ